MTGDTGETRGRQAFAPPGPGAWQRLADHFPGALTPEYRRIYAETCPTSMATYFERYGVLARTLDVAFIHGHLYIAPVPLVGPREMRRPPPAGAVWLMSRIHPTFRRRTRAAHKALVDRPWRAVAQRWFDTERAVWSRRNGTIESLDPSTLSTAELRGHLTDCRTLVVDGYRRHFELHGDDLLPVGLLINRCAEWGIEPSEALAALEGASPRSAGTVEPHPWQLVSGYDLDSSAWIELGSRPPLRTARAVVPTDLSGSVPPADHVELRILVDDARTAVALRDDNGLVTGAWPMGLLRRAMLEAGRRLRLPEPGLAVEFTVDELVDALDGSPTVDPGEAARRGQDRARRSAFDAPATLGPEFALPPLSALPRPLALIGAAQLAAATHMTGGTGAVGIGRAPYTGRALVVDDPAAAFDLMEPGDVVVTRFTSPSWNSILAGAGALVTTTGGLACHAAVIARELGLAAVIGDSGAFDRLTTGDIVLVDPVRATVTAAP